MKPFDLLGHAARARTVLAVLAKHGFADLVNQLDLPPGFWHRLLTPSGPTRTTAERMRMAAEELGTTFIKIGQFLSMRPDVLPESVILELRKLQEDVPALPFEVIKPVLVAELGRAISEVFSEFEETPAASASLAQVYFARLRDGGQEVAVKIQKPGVRATVEIDLDFAVWVAHQIHRRVADLRGYDLPAVIAEARAGILNEMDFMSEARNQAYFNSVNPDPAHAFAPAVFPQYSTERILVMERINGKTIGRAKLDATTGARLAGYGARSLVHQVMIEGFFHGDPHSGNVMVTDDGRICFLDWGLVGHLTRRLRYALADFWGAAAARNSERLVQIGADLAEPDATPDLRALEKEAALILHEELNFTIGRQELGRAMLRLLHAFGKQGIPLSRDFSLMAKAILSIDEVGRILDPKFDLREHMVDVSRELAAERTGPAALYQRGKEALVDLAGSLQGLPGELRRVVRRLDRGSITVNLRHGGLELHDDAMRVAANRIALGVIIGALIIGSSLIVTTGTQPLLFGYPALGIVGYVISAFLGLYVIWDIIRHGRHK